MKKCIKCFGYGEFYSGRNICKKCIGAQKKKYYLKNIDKLKQYRDINKNKNKIYAKKYYEKNKDLILDFMKNRYDSNTVVILKNGRESYKKNKKKYNKQKTIYHNTKLKIDPIFKLRNLVSKAVRAGLFSLGYSKNNRSILQYLPYSFETLKEHLEFQFEPWMTWENHGNYNLDYWIDGDRSTWTWQIDHIIPQSNLPYSSMEDENFKKCWALENLRPLSAKQNIIKGAR